MTCPCPICTESRYRRAEIRAERLRSAAYWLARGLRALAGIEPIRTAPRRN